MQVLFDDDFLNISARSGPGTPGGNILLSFTGIGHGMGGIDVQKPEFFGTGRDFDNLLFLTDKTRSWGNRLEFDRIAEILAPWTQGQRVYSIGNSMGGFLAILCSAHVPMVASLSFSAQYSMNPGIVPWEQRWRKYTRDIPEHRIGHAGSYMQDGTRYVLLSGGMGPDGRQAALFPTGPNIEHFRFPEIEHDLAVRMKERNALSGVIADAFAGTLDPQDISRRSGFEVEQLSPTPKALAMPQASPQSPAIQKLGNIDVNMVLPDSFKESHALPPTSHIEPFDFSLDGGGRSLVINEILEKDLRLMVEIGCFFCGSTRQWLDACPDLTIIGVDPWEGPWHERLEYYKEAIVKPWSKIEDRDAVIASVREHGPFLSACANVREFEGRFFPAQGFSPAKLHDIAEAGVVPDLVYFDSNKQLDDLEVAFQLWPEAVLCGDDWTWAEHLGFPVRPVVNEFCERNGYRVQARGATWLIRRD